MRNTVNRRAFLKKTAGITAGIIGFPYFVRSSALGKAGTVAPSNRLTVVQIGSGSMGTGDLKAFLNFSSKVQVIAVCDVDDHNSANAKRIVDEKNNNQDCRTYRDYRELLNTESCETLSQAFVEPGLADAAPGASFQFERLGYFSVDSKDSQPGSLVFNRSVTLRDTWAKLAKT